MTSNEKIKSIKCVINEFYHKMKCEGDLTKCADECWKGYQQYCDDILQDLDRLEKLEKAIEILKKKRVFISILINSNCVEEYNEILVPEVHLTKKEFEFLKEVFKNA